MKTLKINNKKENLILTVAGFVVLSLLLMVFRSNVEWIMSQFGYHLSHNTITSIIHYAEGGGGVVGAFAAIAGITLPAWAGAAVAALGAGAA